MKLGMVGLPNVGKSTLFNALTNAGAPSANYPFCTIEPNVGVVTVPDPRLARLSEISSSKKILPAILEFVDIAGLVRGASKGEGLGNKFLADIREVDAIVHVVRCFKNDEIVHVDGEINAQRDIETINLELIFADLEIVQRRRERTTRASKGDKTLAGELAFLDRLIERLEDGRSARGIECSDAEAAILAQIPLLSAKPVIYAANLSEDDFGGDLSDNADYMAVQEIAAVENAQVLPICAKIEEDVADMPDEDKMLFLGELGLSQSGLDRIIHTGYSLLGLISYLTTGEQETRAWTITKGTRAPQAAAKIHTDFERGFICAETISFEALSECGSMAAAREKGLVRLEGKDYVVQDGDVVLFRFNV